MNKVDVPLNVAKSLGLLKLTLASASCNLLMMLKGIAALGCSRTGRGILESPVRDIEIGLIASKMSLELPDLLLLFGLQALELVEASLKFRDPEAPGPGASRRETGVGGGGCRACVFIVGRHDVVDVRDREREVKGESRAPWSAAREVSLRRIPMNQAPT